MFAVGVVACGGQVDPLAPVPHDAAEALASCGRQLFPELEITCRVEAAARAAGESDQDLAERACAGIGPDLWREECHFRAGEEFGRRGQLVPAVSHCGRAGQYARFCLTHLGWHVPPDPALDPGAASAVRERMDLWLGQVETSLQAADPSFATSAREVLIAAFWYNVYYGRGDANPAAARAIEGSAAPAARWGWATEAVRLGRGGTGESDPELVEELLRAWDGEAPTPKGAALPIERRHGRYHPAIRVEADAVFPVQPTYGGNTRLVAPDPHDDLIVSLLEGMYLQPDVDGAVFEPWLEHPSAAVRWTAARLVRVTPSGTMDNEAVLTRIAASDDPGLAQHGRDGLRFREWKRFTGGPRPRR